MRLCDTEMRGRPRASARTKNTEESVLAWIGVACDPGKYPFWASHPGCLCGNSAHRGILDSGPKSQSFHVGRKFKACNTSSKQDCYESGKLGTFFNKMFFIKKIKPP